MAGKRSWTGRGGFKSYGKTALSGVFEFGGFEEYFKKIEALGKNIDSACKKAVDATIPIIEKSMRQGAERHRDTGEVVEAIETVKAQAHGDFIYGAVGINLDKHPEAFEGVFQEYGDGHSPGFPDPFVRPAVDDNEKEIKATMRKVLKKEGIL